MQPPRGIIQGFVKVEMGPLPPRLWGWALYRDDGENPIRRSEAAFRCAEDAWKAGRIALAELEAAGSPRPAGAQSA